MILKSASTIDNPCPPFHLTWPLKRLQSLPIYYLSLAHSTRRIHVWYIYLHRPYKSTKHRQMYVKIPYMDPMGYYLQGSFPIIFAIKNHIRSIIWTPPLVRNLFWTLRILKWIQFPIGQGANPFAIDVHRTSKVPRVGAWKQKIGRFCQQIVAPKDHLFAFGTMPWSYLHLLRWVVLN